MLILLIYLIGVVIHMLIVNPDSLDRELKKAKRHHPNFIDDGWRPTSGQIFVSCLLWPFILLSIIFGKLTNKI